MCPFTEAAQGPGSKQRRMMCIAGCQVWMWFLVWSYIHVSLAYSIVCSESHIKRDILHMTWWIVYLDLNSLVEPFLRSRCDFCKNWCKKLQALVEYDWRLLNNAEAQSSQTSMKYIFPRSSWLILTISSIATLQTTFPTCSWAVRTCIGHLSRYCLCHRCQPLLGYKVPQSI